MHLTKHGRPQHHTTRERGKLVAVHGCPLGVAAQLAVRRGADGSAATRVATGGAALLQSQQLLGTEGLVVDLAGGLNQVLQVGTGQEVAQVNELAVVLVLDVDDTPAVLAAANLLAVDNNGLLTADDGEGDDILQRKWLETNNNGIVCADTIAYLNLSVDGTLLIVQLVVIVGVHLQVVESELLLDALLESLALFESERVGLGDDGHDIDDVGQLLQDNDIDGLETESAEVRVSTNVDLMVVTTAGRASKGRLTHDRRAG